jgi:hypothetical protein
VGGPDRAVLVPLGEVGAGVVHVEPDRAGEAARAVAEAPGVDLALARTEDGLLVLGGGSGQAPCQARVRWRGDAYRYECDAGDPLEYATVWKALQENRALHDGWADDRNLFLASWRHRYPDALARARCAFEDLVQHPAAVIFSMRDGWTYGPALTHTAARLVGGQVGTHGSLAAPQSLGFASVTANGDDPWRDAPALRPEDVFRPWWWLVHEGSASSE